jgi:hypothetical protein
MEKGGMSGLMAESSTEIGLIIKCMERDFSIGAMVGHLMGIMRTIRNMVMGLSPGRMVENMRAFGRKANSMEKDSILESIAQVKQVFGRKEKELSGLSKLFYIQISFKTKYLCK